MKYYIVLFLLTSQYVYGKNIASELVDFGVRGINFFEVLSDFASGISNIANVVSNVNDIFTGIFNDKHNQSQYDTTGSISEDTYLNIKELVTKYGYDIEEHKVTTEDGYIITVHRIPPHGRNITKNGQIIFLMHGIIDSSDSWVLQGPDRALAYILAEEGYDVWMGNARGNKHSLEHTKLRPTQSEFWQFTWEEIGLYDLPAMIDYALNVTDEKKLYYIGHSQGTTSFFVMNSLRPEYNSKIKIMFSLAPVTFMRHVKSPIVRLFSPGYKFLGNLMSNFNAFSPSSDIFNKILTIVCSVLTKCDSVLSMIVGNDYRLIDNSVLPIVFGHMPSGSSTNQFVHYGQLVESGTFCRYDFGVRNLQIYGRLTPPDYNLSEVTAPVVIYYSENDWLSDPSDVQMLKSKIKNVIGYYCIKEFNHLDYLYASIAKDVIYKNILTMIAEFEEGNIPTPKLIKNITK